MPLILYVYCTWRHLQICGQFLNLKSRSAHKTLLQLDHSIEMTIMGNKRMIRRPNQIHELASLR